jgi:protein SCO1
LEQRNWHGSRVFPAALLAVSQTFLIAGCHRAGGPQAAGAVSGAISGEVKSYHLKGVIVATDATRGEVEVNSEAIPGFMDAMAMPYKLKDPAIIQDLHAGDHLTATLLVPENGAAMLDQLVVTAQAQPDYKPAAQYHVPTVGDLLPDFTLTNQSGKQIKLNNFRGKTLLITFIYTRCPLSDYCPRMSRNFAAIDQALHADPALYGKTHLLSISFDPAYDSPAVLRSYGEAYTGKYTDETFAHWDFAAPQKADLPRVLQYFDVGATPEKDQTITHSLSTVLVSPEGKVVAWYPTNDWPVKDVIQAMKNVAEGKPAS